MMRRLLTVLTVWTLVLSPGLCLAGALEHLCADCPQGTVVGCDHEDDCANDPCADAAMRPDADTHAATAPTLTLVPLALFAGDRPTPQEHSPLVDDAPPPLPRKNLPRPESDLPLLI